MTQKYIIDKTDLHDLLAGKDLPLSQVSYGSKARAFCVEIAGNMTNGDMIMAMFPYGSYGTNGELVHVFGVGGNGVLVFTRDWWNAEYKTESEDKE